jgi:hypothetical protein
MVADIHICTKILSMYSIVLAKIYKYIYRNLLEKNQV